MCYKDDTESQWKSLKFDPVYLKTCGPMVTKICMGDYVPDTYRDAKFHYYLAREFSPTESARLPTDCSLSYFLGVLTTRYLRGCSGDLDAL